MSEHADSAANEYCPACQHAHAAVQRAHAAGFDEGIERAARACAKKALDCRREAVRMEEELGSAEHAEWENEPDYGCVPAAIRAARAALDRNAEEEKP